MAPQTLHRANGLEQVRAKLLTSLHVGRLSPGDRVPSVRMLAGMTGLSRRTVHRAFLTLAREGFLVARPGSGTFVRDHSVGGIENAKSNDLLSAVERMRGMAAALGLGPAVFADFVHGALGGDLHDQRVTVVECNREQTTTIGTDLKRELRVRPVPIVIDDLAHDPGLAGRVAPVVVTTACHFQEVTHLLREEPVSVHSVALDSSFPREIAAVARRGPIVMLVRDERFAGVFTNLLENLRVPPETIRRIHIVEPEHARSLLASAHPSTFVYVSPTVQDVVDRGSLSRFRLVGGRWSVRPGHLQRLQAELALELAVRRAAVGSR